MTEELSFEHVFEPGDGDLAVLLLHGTGADQHDLVPLGRQVAPDKPLLSPLGKVREAGMPRWFRRLEEGVFDVDDVRRRAAELAGFLDEAADAYDLERFVAVGFSNGANIAGSLLLLHPDALAGAALLRPMVPLEPDELPDLDGVPVLMASGEADRIVPRESAERMAELLEAAGAEVTHRWAKGGHGLDRSEVDEVRRWLDEHGDVLSSPREGPR